MSKRNLRLIVAGGGTAGHVLPALAVIEELQRQGALDAILWIGSTSGSERATAGNAGIPFQAIQTGKLRRYFSLHTVTDAARIPIGIVQARRLIRRFQPTVVFSTGGFVSVPTVVAARGLAPILTHEQTAILGLATRINARVVDTVAVSYESTALLAGKIHRHVVVTGNPVRAFLARGDADRGRARWNFEPAVPFIYVTGGSLGASPLNQRLAALLTDLLLHAQVLHQAGAATSDNDDAARLRARRETWPEDLKQRYQVVERVGDELPDVYAAADVVIGRAGAGTVAEIAHLGKPAILIPLPGTGGDEQTKNAQILADAGAAVLIPQAEATPARLLAMILELLGDRHRLSAMAAAARSVGRVDAAARLAAELLTLHAR
ncbi:MAG: undecaprenyldiphospho-muramoylpentapeptide beta-N-acetylglucosaminyltransferase [Chloroflexota bacterium]|nr:undecaprenyldiphospho-muramoylpentapeptide beta-N-acetylglucosaminyltransferase [Chloroflexota bacterium]